MLLNCDLGELNDIEYRVEQAVMPLIDMANIACGLHAGSPTIMRDTLAIAKAHQVTVGAHPGYADRENFGRVSIPHTPEALTALLNRQISALAEMAQDQDIALAYVKPHGALYNDMIANSEIFLTVLKALEYFDGPKKLMVLATSNADTHRRTASAHNIDLIFETFADRRYNDQGFLISRQQQGAVHDHQRMLEQVHQLCENDSVTTSTGKVIPICADTLCIHGDSPDAIHTIAAIRQLIDQSSRTT